MNPNEITSEEITSFLRFAKSVESAFYEVNSEIKTITVELHRINSQSFDAEPKREAIEKTNLMPSFITIGIIIGAIVGYLFEYNLEWEKVNGLNILAFGAAALICMTIGSVAFGGIFAIIGYMVQESINNKKKRIIDERYSKEMQNYILLKADHDDSVEGFKKVLLTKINDLQQIQSIIAEIRTHLYKSEILYISYQNLPAICQLLQYFESNRFSRLGEAYNQYELEVRLDKIITNLDYIINKLDQIKENQVRLFETLVGIMTNIESLNTSLSSCADSLDSVEANSKLTAVCSAITATTNLLIAGLTKKQLRIGIKREDLLHLERKMDSIGTI